MASSILERLGVWRFPMSPGQGSGTALLTVASGDTVQVGTETNGVYTNIGTYTSSASVSYPAGVGYVVVRKVAGTNSSSVIVPDESARQPVSFDPSDNRLETPDGAAVGGGAPAVAFKPYRLATFGDSRSNVSAGEVASTNAGASAERVAAWVSMERGDIQIVFNGGVSGDQTSGWNSAARVTSSQTVAAALASSPDIVLIQYGINDNIAGTSAASTFSNLQALIAEFIGAGVFVVFESINPAAVGPASYISGYSVAGGYSSTSDAVQAATRLALTAEVNSLVRSWLSGFSGRALFVDTSPASTAQDGYARADQSYYDGTHMSTRGCRAAARIIVDALSQMYPQRTGKPAQGVGRNAINDAMLNVTGGKALGVDALAEAGTVSHSFAVTVDADGDAVQEIVITPTALSSGAWRTRVRFDATFAGASASVSVVAGDVLQAYIDASLDDGAGGAPSACFCVVRPRIYYDDASTEYSEIGGLQSLASPDCPRFSSPVRIRAIPPRRAVKAGMSSSNMLTTAASPTAIHMIIGGNTLAPTRLRLKNGTWRKVA